MKSTIEDDDIDVVQMPDVIEALENNFPGKSNTSVISIVTDEYQETEVSRVNDSRTDITDPVVSSELIYHAENLLKLADEKLCEIEFDMNIEMIANENRSQMLSVTENISKITDNSDDELLHVKSIVDVYMNQRQLQLKNSNASVTLIQKPDHKEQSKKQATKKNKNSQTNINFVTEKQGKAFEQKTKKEKQRKSFEPQAKREKSLGSNKQIGIKKVNKAVQVKADSEIIRTPVLCQQKIEITDSIKNINTSNNVTIPFENKINLKSNALNENVREFNKNSNVGLFEIENTGRTQISTKFKLSMQALPSLHIRRELTIQKIPHFEIVPPTSDAIPPTADKNVVVYQYAHSSMSKQKNKAQQLNEKQNESQKLIERQSEENQLNDEQSEKQQMIENENQKLIERQSEENQLNDEQSEKQQMIENENQKLHSFEIDEKQNELQHVSNDQNESTNFNGKQADDLMNFSERLRLNRASQYVGTFGVDRGCQHNALANVGSQWSEQDVQEERTSFIINYQCKDQDSQTLSSGSPKVKKTDSRSSSNFEAHPDQEIERQRRAMSKFDEDIFRDTESRDKFIMAIEKLTKSIDANSNTIIQTNCRKTLTPVLSVSTSGMSSTPLNNDQELPSHANSSVHFLLKTRNESRQSTCSPWSIEENSETEIETKSNGHSKKIPREKLSVVVHNEALNLTYNPEVPPRKMIDTILNNVSSINVYKSPKTNTTDPEDTIFTDAKSGKKKLTIQEPDMIFPFFQPIEPTESSILKNTDENTEFDVTTDQQNDEEDFYKPLENVAMKTVENKSQNDDKSVQKPEIKHTDTQTTDISSEYHKYSGEFILENLHSIQLYNKIGQAAMKGADSKKPPLYINIPERGVSFSTPAETPFIDYSTRLPYYNLNYDNNSIATSLSEGEIVIPCKCSTSLGEIHKCPFVPNKEMDKLESRPSSRSVLQKEMHSKNLKVNRRNEHNKNWVSYYVSTSSSTDSSEQDEIDSTSTSELSEGQINIYK